MRSARCSSTDYNHQRKTLNSKTNIFLHIEKFTTIKILSDKKVFFLTPTTVENNNIPFANYKSPIFKNNCVLRSNYVDLAQAVLNDQSQ